MGKYKLLVLTIAVLLAPLTKSFSTGNSINDVLHRLSVSKSQDNVKVILIDPGHGGKDVGCSGHKLLEKDIALEIALKIGTLLNERFPEIEVRFTRTTDIFIPLHERVSMANKEDVDLFISLHCNAIRNPQAHGIESYVMGMETSQENMDIAKRENEVILLEDLSSFDPYSDEGHIMIAMMQQNTLEKSIKLADFTQQSISGHTTFRDRGVKQAGFVVLRKVLVPSILVEAGFISNPEDAKKLKDHKEQNKIAHSIVSGIGKYVAYYAAP
ncbi:N-acetylmuramoyl-L-alanine amidase family protein [Portibacter lacus]|uniref:N-acetylmuramoyl-L-alanine amidase family protein n=1 Tax=Portibacter lacus TaxID=1099794 RepID=UPI001F407F87|nr:N-acetylmuramoyl-L-alanine amidase [Portibacter lacus]